MRRIRCWNRNRSTPSRDGKGTSFAYVWHLLSIRLCGGELESGSLVDDKWFLTLERREFMSLLRNVKTQERVVHTLKTGKPLRN